MWSKSALTLSLSSAGALLCVYTLHVQTQMSRLGHDYGAACDLAEHVSCTKVFASKFARGFGLLQSGNVPNPVFALAFYAVVALLALVNVNGNGNGNGNGREIFVLIQVCLCLLANLGSVYLAYVLYLLESLCVVCAATYLVNVGLLLSSWRQWREIRQLGTSGKKNV